MSNNQASITAKESQIVDDLADIWNKFLELPKEHPSEHQDFADGVHVLQRLVFARAGRRSFKNNQGKPE